MKITSGLTRTIATEPCLQGQESRGDADVLLPRAVELEADGFCAASRRLAWRRWLAMGWIDSNWGRLSALEPQPATITLDSLPAGWLNAMPLYPRQTDQYRQLAEADVERSQLGVQDRFEAHDLDERLMEDLCQQLRQYPICQARLVKKTLRFFPEQPLYVLLVEPMGSHTFSPDCDGIDGPAEPTLGTQIAQELRFRRELLVCLTSNTEPQLVARIEASSRPLWHAAD